MNALRALIKKDLLLLLQDRRALVISFALPAALALFFGFAFGKRSGSGSAQKTKLPMLVVDEDRGADARRLVATLAGDDVLTAKEAPAAEARTKVADGDVAVVLLVPRGFPGEKLHFLYDPSRPYQLGMVKGIVGAYVNPAPRFDTVDEAVTGGEPWDGASHAIAGMAVQFILMGAIEAAVGMLTERQRGLWRRLRAAPLSRRTLLLSRIFSGAAVALATLAFLYTFGRFTMGVKVLGSPLGFAVVAVSFALMASTLGVMVSTLGRTPQATRGVGMFVVLVAVMLGGAWFPSFLFPEWLQKLTGFVPTRWAVDALDAMTWRGLGLTSVAVPVASLLGAAAVFTAIAMWRFRWEE